MKRPTNQMSRPLLRILDVNFNRAKEGLRVAEDIMRFLFEDRKLTRELKAARHQLTRILLACPHPYTRLLAERRSEKDIGKKSSVSDRKKTNWRDVLIQNLKRSEEALRVLEEISKVAAPFSVPKFQQLRFKIYELERKAVKKITAVRRY